MRAPFDYDVVILGGGPSGCATAMALRRLGVSDILVAEAGHYEAERIGEGIPPDTRLLMQQLGIWDAFVAEQHDPCPGSCSSWGSDELGFNDFLFNPLGNGWHLDRKRFDAFLARKAVERGVELATGTRFVDCEQLGGDGFSLQLDSADESRKTVLARFVVDATGMRSAFAQRMKATRQFLDRLICVYGFFELPPTAELWKLTMLEAVEDGWWYAARLPNGRVAVAIASDAEIIKQRSLNTQMHWLESLAHTRHIAPKLADCHFLRDSLLVCHAPSYVLDCAAGNGWLAVGDAAAAYDPIAAQGIHKSLSDGLQAADVIAAVLAGDAPRLDEYGASVEARFESYLNVRNHFYGLETRWSDSPFWKRRQERTAPRATIAG